MEKEPVVLALDPGYERLGVAVLTKEGGREKLLYSACARTPKTLPLPQRIGLLSDELREVFTTYKPSAVAFERVYWSRSRSTAFGVAEVRGMIETLAHTHKAEVFQYSPQEVKLAVTGYGASDKHAVALMVPRLVVLPPKKRLDDELDAIAVGITHLASTRSKVAVA